MTAKTKTALGTEITTNFPDNTLGDITPAVLRTTVQDFVDSWQQAPVVNTQSGTTYTISVNDYGSIVTFNNTASIAVTLPQASGSFATFSVFVKNIGSGIVTITPSVSTIDGAATLTLLGTQSTMIVSNGSNYITTGVVPERIRLTAATNYFVTTTGNDSNSGSSAAPFLTIQGAINFIANNVDLAGNDVTINVASGTYTTPVLVLSPWVGTGTVKIHGDTTTPSNVVISTTSASAITVGDVNHAHRGATLSVEGLKITTSTSGSGIVAVGGGTAVITGNMEFGSVVNFQISASFSSSVDIQSNYTISGGASAHINVTNNCSASLAGRTITITGTPAFSLAFVQTTRNGALSISGNTFSGSATGTRYSATLNSVIDTNGAGATYLPGNVGGTTATGGVYN